MIVPPKHILFVRETGLEQRDHKSAGNYLDIIKISLSLRENTDSQTKKKGPAATVEFVDRAEDVPRRLNNEDMVGVDVVVFCSRTMAEEARQLMKMFKRPPRIAVLSGGIPMNEVVFLDKGWDVPGILSSRF